PSPAPSTTSVAPPPGQLSPTPPAPSSTPSTPPPGQLSPSSESETQAPPEATSPAEAQAAPPSASMELAALKAKREKVALVAPLLLMGIGVVAAAQGAAFIVINDNSSFPSDGLKTVGIVFIAGGATAFIAGAALLPVRLSKR